MYNTTSALLVQSVVFHIPSSIFLGFVMTFKKIKPKPAVNIDIIQEALKNGWTGSQVGSANISLTLKCPLGTMALMAKFGFCSAG